jgi:hypothetical protein
MLIRLLWLALLALAGQAAADDDVFRAYPASYELVRLAPGGEQVLASGRVLLREGQTIAVAEHAGGAEITEVHAGGGGSAAGLRFTLERPDSDGSMARLILISEVDLVVQTGTRRYEIPGSPGSFIQGPATEDVSFRNRSWRRAGDPTPVVVPFRQQGDRYRLTVLFDPGTF